MREGTFSKSCRILVTIGVVALVTLAVRPAAATLAPGDCVDFEDLTLATVYNVSDGFADSGVTMTAAQTERLEPRPSCRGFNLTVADSSQ